MRAQIRAVIDQLSDADVIEVLAYARWRVATLHCWQCDQPRDYTSAHCPACGAARSPLAGVS